MILANITAGLAERVRTCPPLQQVYEVPPAGTPEVPCVVINFPTVVNYHHDLAHALAVIEVTMKVILGRGDAEGAYRQFQELLSTEGANSLIEALESKAVPQTAWQRLKVLSHDTPRDEGDNITITLSLNLDA